MIRDELDLVVSSTFAYLVYLVALARELSHNDK